MVGAQLAPLVLGRAAPDAGGGSALKSGTQAVDAHREPVAVGHRLAPGVPGVVVGVARRDEQVWVGADARTLGHPILERQVGDDLFDVLGGHTWPRSIGLSRHLVASGVRAADRVAPACRLRALMTEPRAVGSAPRHPTTLATVRLDTAHRSA